ncbi:hypothetical protein ABW20_dc0100975 [Dactylellina cionopaga]|nr:hypothetical protein ABW20_dc0100975 [Dactylellina cionopaga]
MLDERHPTLPKPSNDHNTYSLGSIENHNIVITCLPKGKIGTVSAAAVITRPINTFPSTKFSLMVGIGGGIPPKVRLGDVVVSVPVGKYPGVIQRDLGEAIDGEIVRRKARDMKIHYGLIASGNQAIEDAMFRDKLNRNFGGSVLCVEMEAAGLLNEIPCIVIRGICDYADSHKNKHWHEYVAITAAAFAKKLLGFVQPSDVEKERPARELVQKREAIEKINVVIPFIMSLPRNSNFCGRADELRKIYKYFADPELPRDVPAVLTLIGTGGMGKSQIALEYAYRHNRDYTAVFWVSAANETTIKASFVDIVQRIVREQARISWPESEPDYEIVEIKLGIPGLVDGNGTVDAEAFNVIQAALFR